MKKTVALLLCCLLLAGSLIAMAGGTCAHDGAQDVETVDTEFGCWTLHYQKETCRRCGEETLTLLGREDDRHEGAATRDPLRGWIVVLPLREGAHLYSRTNRRGSRLWLDHRSDPIRKRETGTPQACPFLRSSGERSQTAVSNAAPRVRRSTEGARGSGDRSLFNIMGPPLRCAQWGKGLAQPGGI